MELKDRELKDREKNIKGEIIIPKNDMDKFEEQGMKKIRSIMRKLFDKLIKQNVMTNKPKIIREKLKDKIIRYIWTLFETEREKNKERNQRKRKNKMKN